jgi:murein DD-endopeptidase MepM/ murein hydrolase activator NlpD
MPSDGYLSRGFDGDAFHYGIDLAGKQGNAILAAANGSVVFAGWTYDDGLMMMIAHDFGYLTVYKHTKALLKGVGSAVRRGEPVALLGNTGKTSSGPHLHFELWRDGVATDPMKYLVAAH